MICVVFISFALLLSGAAFAAQNNGDSYKSLEAQAVAASNQGDVSKALNLFKRELQWLMSQARLAEAGAIYCALGEVYQVHGDFPSAEAHYKQGLHLLKENAPPADFRTVAALDDLGWLYVTWGKLDEASRLIGEARVLAERLRANDPGLIRHLDTQAAYLVVIGKYSDAEKSWNRALAIGQLVFGPDSPEYDTILIHFGQACDLSRDYDAAAEFFRRYISIEDRLPHGASPSRAVAAGELGHVYTELHKFDEARRWFEDSLMNSNAVDMPLVYSMIVSYYGDYFMATSQWRDAETQYRKALAIQERVLGDNHAVAASMILLAKALRKLHGKAEAKRLETRAQQILVDEKFPAAQQTVDVLALRHENRAE